MPEIPDIVAYCEALEERLPGEQVHGIRIASPFVLRTADPAIDRLVGQTVSGVERLGKRIVIRTEEALFLVIHLMIAGRFRWFDAGTSSRKKPPAGKQLLASITFSSGTLYLTEAGSRRRASIHLVDGREALDAMNPGGLEVLETDRAAFFERVRATNHTLKRVLTDPRILSGIGNAYSDEILHRAGLSPMLLSQRVDDEILGRLFEAIREVLEEWIQRLRDERAKGDGFPEKVTAFRPEMAAHGRYGKPCPVCEAPIQRIVYASNETNYCARCQTKGVVLKDRALSKLLKDSWPSRLDD